MVQNFGDIKGNTPVDQITKASIIEAKTIDIESKVTNNNIMAVSILAKLDEILLLLKTQTPKI